MNKRKKVILDVDTGSDDSFAIVLALLSGKLDVVAITVTWGNNPVEECVDNTLKVVELCGKDTPVYRGCPGPMVKNLHPARAALSGADKTSYFENGKEICLHPHCFDLPMHLKAQEQHAVTYLVETLMKTNDKITIIAVGPHTNIGMALQMEPRIKEHIEEIVSMGGAVELGNCTPTAEANFYHDPEAIKIILNSGIPYRIVGLNATTSAHLDETIANELGEMGKIGSFLKTLLLQRDRVAKHLGWAKWDGYTIHDGLAVASVIDETVITEWRDEKADIDIASPIAEGSLLLDHRGRGEIPNCKIAMKADRDKYVQMLKQAIAMGAKE